MTQPSLPHTPPEDGGKRGRTRDVTKAIAFVLVSSLVLDGLTSFAQTVLPDSLRSFSNSASGWTMLAFPLVWATKARPGLGAGLGVIALVGLVEGYALVSNLRGFYYSYVGIFTLIGLVAGPVVGAAAALTRHGAGTSHPRLWRILGITPLSGVLIGEGLYGVRYVSETTGTTYWIITMALGIAFLVLANVRQRPRPLYGAASVLVTAVGSVAFFAAYSALSSQG